MYSFQPRSSLPIHPWNLLLLLTVGCADEPNFNEVYDEVLSLSCAFSTCHGGGTTPSFEDLDAAYTSLVNTPSASAADEVLVVPGNADNSYLVKKLENAAGIEGELMPPSQELSEEKINLIRSWIDAGALSP